jgi:hypothetical protein
VEAECETAVGYAIFGNIALHVTDINTRPTSKFLYLIQRYRRVRETLSQFLRTEKVAPLKRIEAIAGTAMG